MNDRFRSPVAGPPPPIPALLRAEGAMTDRTETPPPSPGIACTVCRFGGGECAAALHLARHLLRADALARATVPEFEITGETRLAGCARTCGARFRLSPGGVELFCGAAPDADMASLSAFAAAFLAGDATALAHPPCPPPLAFAVSVPAMSPRPRAPARAC